MVDIDRVVLKRVALNLLWLKLLLFLVVFLQDFSSFSGLFSCFSLLLLLLGLVAHLVVKQINSDSVSEHPIVNLRLKKLVLLSADASVLVFALLLDQQFLNVVEHRVQEQSIA